MSTTTTRRSKWHYPPPQTPRILHFPPRPRRRQPSKSFTTKPICDYKGKLESSFDHECEFFRGEEDVPVVMTEFNDEKRRERVEESDGVVVVEEEKWRFQAEMLRAECNLLRMEKEIALKKLDRCRVHMERTLRSALHTLMNGRKRIQEGKNISMVLDEEIQELGEKLDKLKRGRRGRYYEVRKPCNFDVQASLLRRRLDKFHGVSSENSMKEVQEMAEGRLPFDRSCKVDIISRTMDELSKGVLLERMEEECESLHNSSVASSASVSKHIQIHEPSPSSVPHLDQDAVVSHGKDMCSAQCKVIVERVVEQVRAETEQWSQMQEMLGQVRKEVEELQESRDFWEDRALDSDHQIKSLQLVAQEWREKAVFAEGKARDLHADISVLGEELAQLRKEHREKIKTVSLRVRCDPQQEKEKRVLICRLKENHHKKDDSIHQEGLSNVRRKMHTCISRAAAQKRSPPFQDIGNTL